MVESKAKNLKKMLSWSESSDEEDEDELKAIEKEVISHRRQGDISRGVNFKPRPFEFLRGYSKHSRMAVQYKFRHSTYTFSTNKITLVNFEWYATL